MSQENSEEKISEPTIKGFVDEDISFSFTVTFGETSENGPDMENNGEMRSEGGGFDKSDLDSAVHMFEATGAECQLHVLHDALPLTVNTPPEAHILVIHNATQKAFGVDPISLREELKKLEWNRQKLMKGTVKTCRARRNVCFGPQSVAADIMNGKGTVVGWNCVPLLNEIRNGMVEFLGEKAEGLLAEGNFYHHEKAGIGFHGDGERRVVIGVRVGEPLQLHYQWYHDSKPIGKRIRIDDLVEGDMYVMSEKATGWDWKRPNLHTLRHAAERFHEGKDKYCKTLQTAQKGPKTKRQKCSHKKVPGYFHRGNFAARTYSWDNLPGDLVTQVLKFFSISKMFSLMLVSKTFLTSANIAIRVATVLQTRGDSGRNHDLIHFALQKCPHLQKARLKGSIAYQDLRLFIHLRPRLKILHFQDFFCSSFIPIIATKLPLLEKLCVKYHGYTYGYPHLKSIDLGCLSQLSQLRILKMVSIYTIKARSLRPALVKCKKLSSLYLVQFKNIVSVLHQIGPLPKLMKLVLIDCGIKRRDYLRLKGATPNARRKYRRR